ncbi:MULTISPECIES: hypothetical protein [Streptomyces]|uniref:hypothetical protein n=1 Tax=Streptomyces TaxID=1883 RepID=UPI00017E8033|nr:MULTISPECIES: hypothetical protein [Streptomyces]AKL70902.1 hypothetical protein M444_36840 [Streptomyces sp. Mg1]EDX23834.1 hypothetical protein SSAG_03519 [Streptomyces sp. Mg1]WSS03470.1 hypothetical protein OG224_35915 [Streptomyces goshikiensis]WSY02599.1 hypothetical protein OG590_35775 [Streptomyces goshikiensis]
MNEDAFWQLIEDCRPTEPDPDAELLLYTPDRAYKRITGEEWDRDTRYSYESCSNVEGWAD